MKQIKLQSKNKCPNCGNQYWYTLEFGPNNTLIPTDIDFIIYRGRYFCISPVLIVDDKDCCITSAVDICTNCEIALTRMVFHDETH